MSIAITKDSIKGRWGILAWEQIYDDGRIVLPMGKELEGFIEYSDHGMFCVVSKKGREAFKTGGQWDAADAEKAAAYNSYLTYAGQYDVEGGNTIIHHVHYSIFPNWIGGSQRRAVEFDGETLALTARLEAGTPEARIAKLSWKRIG